MSALLLSAGFVFGSAINALVAAPLPAPQELRAAPVLEVTVVDPELEQMARDLEREVFPLLPKGAATIRR
jgi:hypothetical protein